MKAVRHEAVSASAGSGKTYRLARRYIALLAAGVEPERICALTFSRKAAGEIFDAIVEHLAGAAADDAAAAAKARELENDGLGRADFAALLRAFTAGLHRARIGTLDSFVVGVVRAFPMELGVAPDFRVMENGSAEAEGFSRAVLARLLAPDASRPAARRAFHEAFKQATFGSEEKDVPSRLDEFIGALRGLYRHVPRAERWGVAETIWPEPPPWRGRARGAEQAAAELLAWIEAGDMPADLAEGLRRFIAFAAAYDEHSRWDESAARGRAAEGLLAAWPDLLRGKAALRYRKSTLALDATACRRLAAVLSRLAAVEIDRSLRRTRGMFGLLEAYCRCHDEQARRGGRLTFEDAQHLLAAGGAENGGPPLSREPGRADRLYIDYRLDCRLDHWLLDEFQDTSDLQWDAFRNLADEILQDTSGRRSFFYVGDVKQAVYGWRGGNPQLFTEILREYAGAIELSGLHVTYRSVPAVVQTVNAVFGDVGGETLPGGAVSRWRDSWQEHRCAPARRDESGYAALLEPAAGEDGKPGGEDERIGLTAALLREISPVARGLETAVLVRSNRAGKRIVGALRGLCPDMPVVHEGKASIKDDPSVVLLLALVTLAAHPGDTYARRVFEMSPLGPRAGGGGPAGADLLDRIHRDGFRGFVRHWAAELQAAGGLSDFARFRLADLAAAADEFDAGGSRDADDFAEFAEAYQVRDPSARNAVRVMTVHQAKGLGFDLVILPDLMQGNMARAREVDTVCGARAEDGRPAWVLKMPRRAIAALDDVLGARLRASDEQACFEELCVLYVALTRAKRGLYMIGGSQGRAAESVPPGIFLKERLLEDPRAMGAPVRIGGTDAALLFARGAADWHAGIEAPAPAPAAADLPRSFARRASRRARLKHVEPSAAEDAETRLAWVFDPESSEVLEFGRAVHELFQRVEWLEQADPEAVIRAWLPSAECGDAVRRDACAQFRRALAAEPVRAELARPDGPVELWREKSFEVILDRKLVAGAFDRVTIRRDAGGRAVAATILDYKSNRVEDRAAMARAAERYAEQLRLYRRALARILNLAPARIRTAILFTRAAALQRVP